MRTRPLRHASGAGLRREECHQVAAATRTDRLGLVCSIGFADAAIMARRSIVALDESVGVCRSAIDSASSGFRTLKCRRGLE